MLWLMRLKERGGRGCGAGTAGHAARIPPRGLCLLPESGDPGGLLLLLPRPARRACARLAQLAQGAAQPRCADGASPGWWGAV